jgi:AraC family transcriptional activator of pobA
MPSNTTAIPVYGLYGEAFTNSDPGFVHIEDIAARSSDLGWLIKPHRHSRLLQVLCIFDGELEVKLNRETHALAGSWLVTIPAGVVHGFRFQPHSRGFVLSIAANALARSSDQEYSRHTEQLHLAPQLMELHRDDGLQKQFLHYIELIQQEFDNFNTDREQALALLSRLALLTLSRQLRHNTVQTSSNKDSLLLGRFRALVEQHYRQHWSVAQYAEALHVSTSTLSRSCHEVVNESPKTIIQQRLLAEAKRRLVYTRQSNEEIAYTLGFKDHAYFARFFKKLEGVTAGGYRKTAADE